MNTPKLKKVVMMSPTSAIVRNDTATASRPLKELSAAQKDLIMWVNNAFQGKDKERVRTDILCVIKGQTATFISATAKDIAQVREKAEKLGIHFPH